VKPSKSSTSFHSAWTCSGTAFDLETRKNRIAQIEKELSRPDIWKGDRAQHLSIELKGLKSIVEPYEKALTGIVEYRELLEMAPDGDEVVEEIHTWTTRQEGEVDRIELASLLSGKNDEKNVFFTIRAGAGGTDACDFAEMLYRMHTRWMERTGYTISLLDMARDDEAGIKYATLFVRGVHPFGYLKSEMGVHRLVRISPFNFSGKRQTSFAAVDVMPETEEISVDLKESDLEISTMKAGGPGGQHVNKTESAVRIVHKPTGISVECRNERSQHLNRRMALRMLTAKLTRYEEAQREKELAKLVGEKGEITFGSQIRSYVLNPYSLVKDHRTGTETGNVQKVLDGDLDEFIQAYLRWKDRPL
jgi:peptide chain release factor 2